MICAVVSAPSCVADSSSMSVVVSPLTWEAVRPATWVVVRAAAWVWFSAETLAADRFLI